VEQQAKFRVLNAEGSNGEIMITEKSIGTTILENLNSML
jgi:hypothetical protein